MLAAMTTAAAKPAASTANPVPPLACTAYRKLFGPGEGFDPSYAYTRIPVLAVTSDGTLLAAVEARRGTGGDWAETHLLMRRSHDGGATWSTSERVCVTPAVPTRNEVPSSHADAKRSGDYFVHGNLSLMPGPAGRVDALFVFEYHRVFHRVSRDHGRTWSAAVEVTDALRALHARYPWKVCATGPGGSLRLRSGRLIAPVWLSLSTGSHGHRPSVVTTIMSDDDGATWRHGDLIAVDGDHAVDGRRIVNPNESALVELADGSVLIDMRTESAPNRRLHAVSSDGGQTFGHPRFIETRIDTVCEASIVRAGDRLLATSPDPRDGGPMPQSNATGNHSLPRRRLVLTASTDAGATWRPLGTIDPGTIGYSHLAATGGRVWCLYERNENPAAWANEVGIVSWPA